jgi:hypothetical protein
MDDAKLAQAVRDADVVILLSKKGRAGVAYFKDIGKVPSAVEVSYGERDDPPLTIRRVVVKAGWTLADWRKIDRSALHRSAAGQEDSG